MSSQKVVVLVRLGCLVKDGMRGLEAEAPVGAHRAIGLDGLGDGLLRGMDRRKLDVQVEFIFQNAVHPFGHGILIAMVLVRHARDHAELVQAREVVVATVLGGFNRSSQHLQPRGVYGATRWMDEAVDREGCHALSGGSLA